MNDGKYYFEHEGNVKYTDLSKLTQICIQFCYKNRLFNIAQDFAQWSCLYNLERIYKGQTKNGHLNNVVWLYKEYVRCHKYQFESKCEITETECTDLLSFPENIVICFDCVKNRDDTIDQTKYNTDYTHFEKSLEDIRKNNKNSRPDIFGPRDNRGRKEKIDKTKIISLYQSGHKHIEISKLLGLKYSTVANFISKYKKYMENL